MKRIVEIEWPTSITEAQAIQQILKEKIVLSSTSILVKKIAGCDIGYSKDGNKMWGVCVVMEYPSLAQLEVVVVQGEVNFPYIPGLLSFREGPCLIKALRRLREVPNLIIFDGQGIAHPHSLGIATHLGILLKKPTIGCAKSLLIGEYKEPGPKKGNFSYLYYCGKKIGGVLRTRTNTSPLFVSPGFKIDIQSSIEIILNCCRRYRLPEPIRQAHIISKRLTTKKTSVG
jgi:deoxyribonuclease V